MSQEVYETTVKLIKDQLNLLPRYCNQQNLCGLSIHHPMMMYSLYYIGASKERIIEASESYLNYMTKKVTREVAHFPQNVIDQQNYKNYLGKEEQFYNFLDFFEQEQNRFENSQQFLKYYLNQMPSFLYSEAFHCIIKLGFFLEMNLTDAYPQILAYIAICNFELMSVDEQKPALSVSQIIEKILDKREHFEQVNLSGIIVDRMKIIDSDQVFRDILSHPILYEGEKTQKELVDFLIKIYWQTSNFTIMHGFNSFLSFQKVLNLMNDEKQAFQSYFIGLMSAFITTFKLFDYSNINKQINNIQIQENLPSYEEIFKKVALSNDDHDAKTVYALHQQQLKDPNNKLFQQKAAQIAKLI
ncbi:hypothetical protein TTHERM_00773550 (macronuclear) [Tetrahymena thermophila SB210]|uniref:Uncharacterized protein n=1 Tax=Tetrahymena thermophila (strain SB210) TaxID=312017 RepID=I7LZH5_TETTS|nr:hypothetical protein TTHERM_00773550 [Tetrahymena thermophila SB210]EAR83945.2 hypothetical protein TTHERM_00773550 [Tetrahymena thermophila SB210]|eukprot:XP_001031608.2 hypothetical protein TTHERM_00773550 [Tetrahymena thermophila SB210]